MDRAGRIVRHVRSIAPRPDPISASEVSDRVALLLIEAAVDHDRVGHHLLADLLRQRASEVLQPAPEPTAVPGDAVDMPAAVPSGAPATVRLHGEADPDPRRR